MPPAAAAIWRNEEFGLRCILTSGWYQIKSLGPPFQQIKPVGVPRDLDVDKLKNKFTNLRRDVVEDLIEHLRRHIGTLCSFSSDQIHHPTSRLKQVQLQTHTLAIC